MNRIAKIEARGNGLAHLFDADGAQIGGLDAWASCAAEPDDSGDTYLAEIARRWPSPEPEAPAVLPNGLPPVGTRGFLRNGWPARVIANDLAGEYPLAIACRKGHREDDEAVSRRKADGSYHSGTSSLDIILPPRVSDATVEAAEVAWTKNGATLRTAIEAAIAHHIAEQEGRA